MMNKWLGRLTLLAVLAAFAAANDVELVSGNCTMPPGRLSLTICQKQDNAHRQRCSGMYSRKSWGGQVDPYILIKFQKRDVGPDEDPLASLVMFEWNDEPLIGRYPEGSHTVE